MSHDEKKAAEAAYQGRPFHPSWSKSARAIYEGILKAKGMTVEPVASNHDTTSHPVDEPELVEEILASASDPTESTALAASNADTHQITSRQEAIEAGLLIDVTQKAKGVGFNVAVGITKSLWRRSISPSFDNETPEGETRVRDMLLAVRLRLASLESPAPWVEVPVLFPAAQGEKPGKIFPIYALFHRDPVADDCLTLIHPKELSSIRPTFPTNTEEEQSSSDLA